MRSGDLFEDRQVVAAAVDRHPDAEPWMWERDANGGRYSSYDLCVRTAATSDILILIVGEVITPVTEAEWRAARASGVNCAMLLKAVESRTPETIAFIAAQRADSVDASYNTPEELRLAVEQALRRCNTDGVRQRQVARRMRGDNLGSGTHLLEAGIERAEVMIRAGDFPNASEILAQLEMLVGPHQRPESLDLVTGLVRSAGGDTRKAIEAYQRVIENKDSTWHAKAVARQNSALELMRVGELASSRRQMRAAVRMFADNDDWFGVLQVLINLGNLNLAESNIERASTVADLAAELLAASTVPLPDQRASIEALRAGIAVSEGRYSDALDRYRVAWSIARRARDGEGMLVAAQCIAASYRDLGRSAMAERWADKAVDLSQGARLWRQEEVYRLRALIRLDRGDLQAALQDFVTARTIAAEMGDTRRVGTLTADAAAVAVELGRSDARARLAEARRMLTELDEPTWVARVDLNEAIVDLREGELGTAAALLERIGEDFDVERALRADAYEQLGEMHLAAGRLSEAAVAWRRGLALSPRVPASAVLAAMYGHALQDAGDLREAKRFFDNGLQRARRLKDQGVAIDIQIDRALLSSMMGRDAEALADLEAALDAAKALSDPRRQVRALHNIGELSRRSGDLVRSIRVLRRGHALAVRSGDSEAARSILGILSLAQLTAERADDARASANQLLAQSRGAKDRANEAHALGVLAGVEFQSERYRAAADLYRSASRLNRDDPIHHAEDLAGILESHAAADRWRPGVRAAQALVDHAQKHGVEALAWRSLLRAAKWCIDRGAYRRAATLTTPAWVLSTQVGQSGPQGSDSDDGGLNEAEFAEALMTTCFDELRSGVSPSEKFYDQVIDGLDPEGQTVLREMVDAARTSATNAWRRQKQGGPRPKPEQALRRRST